MVTPRDLGGFNLTETAKTAIAAAGARLRVSTCINANSIACNCGHPGNAELQLQPLRPAAHWRSYAFVRRKAGRRPFISST